MLANFHEYNHQSFMEEALKEAEEAGKPRGPANWNCYRPQWHHYIAGFQSNKYDG